MTLVGSEKRQIRKCFMLISMEISLIYRRLLPGPGLARAGRALGGRAAGATRVTRALPMSPSARLRRAPLPCSRFFSCFLSSAVLGFLSHDSFIGASPPDPFKLVLLPGISKEICGSPSRDAAYKVISLLRTTSITGHIVLLQEAGQGWVCLITR